MWHTGHPTDLTSSIHHLETGMVFIKRHATRTPHTGQRTDIASHTSDNTPSIEPTAPRAAIAISEFLRSASHEEILI
jgi:hypothetical protein